MVKTIDLFEIKPETRSFEVLHPASGEPIGLNITLMSADDPKMKPIIRQIIDRNNQLKKRGKVLKAAEIDQNQTALYGATIVEWNWYGDISFKGEKPKLNPKNVKEVLTELSWLASQIEDELSDEKGFFQT